MGLYFGLLILVGNGFIDEMCWMLELGVDVLCCVVGVDVIMVCFEVDCYLGWLV